MIRKLVAVLGVPASVLLLTTAVSAGDYHKDGSLRCADCHVMHYSQQHGYNPDGSGFFVNPASGGAFHYLLRAEINDLCLACHDNSPFAPDVLGANGGNSDLRLGGRLNDQSGLQGFETTGHTLDSTAVAPGSNPAWAHADGLNCTNCHQQHGYGGYGHPDNNQQYRNLKSDPGNIGSAWVLYNWDQHGTNDLTKDVFERASAAYDESDVDWNEPDNTTSAIGNWCGGCHTDFHGLVGSAEIGGVGTPPTEFVRHPDGGVNIGEVGGGHSSLTEYNLRTNKVKVMSEIGVWDPAGADVTPTCVSCHKAHGTQNSFGLILRSGGGTLTESGDTGAENSPTGPVLEHLCGQCHVQASFFAQS